MLHCHGVFLGLQSAPGTQELYKSASFESERFVPRAFLWLSVYTWVFMDGCWPRSVFSLPVRVANHCAGFSSSCPLAEVAMHIIKNEAAEGNTNMVRLTETIM